MKDRSYDIIVVGAGFAGLYALHKLRHEGHSVHVVEAGEDIGGTWFWNKYPGARCDIESMQYSYSFSEEIQQEWSWSEVYAAQPEILAYMHFVAERLDLMRDIQLGTRVVQARYLEDEARWRITTDVGETFLANFCVMATGSLSVPLDPDLPGLDQFAGDLYKTHSWPKSKVSFAGKRVGVIGTGSSGIQVIPIIAREARHLTVFQRTANFSIPLRNKKMPREYERDWKQNYAQRRTEALSMRNNVLSNHTGRSGANLPEDELRRVFEQRWQMGGISFPHGFNDTATNQRVNQAAADLVRRKIAETVEDAEIAESLTPKDHPIGSKRLCADTEYYQTFNRDNVTLVDLRRTPIEKIEEYGIRSTDGFHKLDVLVLATGFDAMTGALCRIALTGRNGLTIQRKWGDAPKTLFGVAVAGFPNLFLITGPGSPSVFSNFVTSIEQNVDWIADCLAYMKARGYNEVEATQQAEAAWFGHVNDVASRTLLPKANSWYMGTNVRGKPRYLLPYFGGVPAYRAALERSAASGYEGFRFGICEERYSAVGTGRG